MPGLGGTLPLAFAGRGTDRKSNGTSNRDHNALSTLRSGEKRIAPEIKRAPLALVRDLVRQHAYLADDLLVGGGGKSVPFWETDG